MPVRKQDHFLSQEWDRAEGKRRRRRKEDPLPLRGNIAQPITAILLKYDPALLRCLRWQIALLSSFLSSFLPSFLPTLPRELSFKIILSRRKRIETKEKAAAAALLVDDAPARAAAGPLMEGMS